MNCWELFHVLMFFAPFFFFKSSIALDTIAPDQILLDNGTSLLVSRNEVFELGFFSPRNSSNRYVGIWFKKIPEQTVVWVANRNAPIPDSTGSLSVTTSGMIIISMNQSNVVWAANSSSGTVNNPNLKLLDNGNLVLKTSTGDDDDPGSYLWQSFDHPSDTLIPGMKLGWNLETHQEWYLTSWKSIQDPSLGEYTYRVNPAGGMPSTNLLQGSNILFRSGPWDGVRFGGDLSDLRNTVFKPIFRFDSKNAYYTFENTGNSVISRFVVNESGLVQHLSWSRAQNQWIEIARVQADTCNSYAKCGDFGICDDHKSPICDCLTGFVPRSQEWSPFAWAGGCIRRTPLNCSTPTGFRKFSSVKVPDTTSAVDTGAMSPEECQESCFRNCSCVAYTMTPASRCEHWSGDLVDIKVYAAAGLDLFVRMPVSELGSSNKQKRVAATALVSVAVSLFLVLVIWLVIRMRSIKNKADQQCKDASKDQSREEDDLDLPLFDFPTISTATDDFSLANKIGEGGFGRVYKGVLSSGKEVAVKRLSEDSGQGLTEFKNEVILISKLQHRNLVRLLGCCIHIDERMLVYEYMPNGSLDLLIFNRNYNKLSQWKTRFDIIVGIARGLLYLHRDSRLRIIHRDLKVSNILLDSEMNPKISDFGLARTFRGDQYQDNTNRIVGTYGYMAPEYARDGLFSVKSDVFSFGVVVLEIVSGEKNRGFYHSDHDHNLLGHAWRLWNEGNPADLLDTSLETPYLKSEAVRCIHVGLLCVQQHLDDRPTMSDALLMLDSKHQVLVQPKQPAYYLERTVIDADSSPADRRPRNSNEITVTLLHGR